MHPPSRWLTAAAALCFGIALLHAAMIFMDPHAYGYFGAPQLGRAKAAGYSYPDLMTVGLVLVFATFGAYALSGAGRIRRLPLLPVALVLIGAVFTVRGLVLFPQLVQLATGKGAPPRMAVFSLVSLVTGVAFLAGTRSRWSGLRG
ncbi:MAG TPA: hypothetical protein VFT45_11805 [Longimicrobium sp.]|nr:hypothetical protein [Longimicrobium sp.]